MNTHRHQSSIIAAIKAGWTYRRIEKEYGCSHVMITYQKRKLGMKIRIPDKTKEKDVLIATLLKSGKKYKEICKEAKTHTQRIVKVKKGIKTKNRKEESFGGWF